MPQDNEASVEEILESIKKVIARDSRESLAQPSGQTKAPTNAPAEEPSVEEESADEILDLADLELAQDEQLDVDTPLINAEVRDAMQENLAALAVLAEPGAKPQIVRSGETSLEGLTRELLRPMLAQWLDTHLPGMVEKMVQAEIARIAGKRG